MRRLPMLLLLLVPASAAAQTPGHHHPPPHHDTADAPMLPRTTSTQRPSGPRRVCAVADATVAGQAPAGTAATLSAGWQQNDATGATTTARTLLRFPPTRATATDLAPPAIASVSVELYLRGGTGAPSVPLELRPAGAPWDETTVTWASQPAAGPPLLAVPFASGAGYVGWTATGSAATALLAAATTGGLVVQGPEQGASWSRAFASREAARPPRLVITYAPTGPTSDGNGAGTFAAPGARAQVSPPRGDPGDALTLTGAGFGERVPLLVTWDAPGAANQLATGRTTASGAFTLPLTIPAAALPGRHLVLVFWNADPVDIGRPPLLAQLPVQVERPCDSPPGGAAAISLSPTSGPFTGGNPVTVSGTGFAPGADVQLTLDDPTSAALATPRVAADGSFRQTVTVPPGGASRGQVVFFAQKLPAGVAPIQLAAATYFAGATPAPDPSDRQPPDVSVTANRLRDTAGNLFGLDLLARASDPGGSYAGVASLVITGTLQGVAGAGPAVLASCSDGGGWSPTLQCAGSMGSPFPPGATGVSFYATATDRSGNAASTAPQLVSFTRQNLAFAAAPIEVNESVQSSGNGLPLVAGKTAVVRLFAVSDFAAVPGVSAQLAASLDGVPLPGSPFRPINGPLTIPARAQLDRTTLAQTLAFVVPIPAIASPAATLSLQAVLDPDQAVDEIDEGDNAAGVSLSVQRGRTLLLELFWLQYVGQNGSPILPNATDESLLESWLLRAYPIGGLRSNRRVLVWPRTPTNDVDDINDALDAIRDQELDTGTIERRARYYAMVPDDQGRSFMRGKAAGIGGNAAAGPTGTPGPGGWDTDASYGDWYGGHEIGHSLGRRHPGFCGQDGREDDNFPYPNGQLGVPNRDVAVDTATTPPALMTAPTWTDVMTYCNSEWVSPYTWMGLLDKLRSDDPDALPARVSDPMLAGDFVRVAGRVRHDTGEVTLYPFWRLARIAADEQPTAGGWSVRAEAQDGRVLASVPFDPAPDTDPAPGQPPSNRFAVKLPFAPGVARFAVYQGTTLRAQRAVSHAVPALTATATGGRVSWQGRDADGDALTYRVLYSADGHDWHAVTGPLRGVDRVELDPAHLPGGDHARFRVEASDGVHVARADTGAVAIPRKPPTVAIEGAPAAIAADTAFVLRAAAHDLQDDHRHRPVRIEWRVDGAPVRGDATLAVPPLPRGRHVVEVTATSGGGQSARDQLVFDAR